VTAELNKKTESIREMIDQRLKAVAATELGNLPASGHLDEDIIAAFVEGRMTNDECHPVVTHLAACGLCRRASAQFVQLENQIDAEPAASEVNEEPGRLEAVLSRLRAAVPSVNDEVVFAYQNPDEDEKRDQTTPPVTDNHE